MRKTTLLILAACGMFSAGCCQSPAAPEKEMSVQLYSARDLIGSAELYAKNHEEVLKAHRTKKRCSLVKSNKHGDHIFIRFRYSFDGFIYDILEAFARGNEMPRGML